MKRALIGIVSFLAIAVIGLYLYLSLTDFSEYRTDIEEAVFEASVIIIFIGIRVAITSTTCNKDATVFGRIILKGL